MDEFRALVDLIEQRGAYALVAIFTVIVMRLIGLVSDYFDFGEKKIDLGGKQEDTTLTAIKLASAIAKRFDQIESRLQERILSVEKAIHENNKTNRSIGKVVVRVNDEIRLLRVSLEAQQGFNRVQAQNMDVVMRAIFTKLDKIERDIILISDTLADTQEIEHGFTDSR